MNDDKLDLIIFMNSCGPNTMPENFNDAITSIRENIGESIDYKFYFATDNSKIKELINVLFKDTQDSILELKYFDGTAPDTWAKIFNDFVDNNLDKTKYVLVSHDDVLIKTPDFFKKTLKHIEGKEEKVGWICYNCTYDDKFIFLEGLPSSGGPGFAPDRHTFPYISQYHNFADKRHLPIRENMHLLDYPEPKPVKVHSVPMEFCLISSDSLKKVGHSGNWTAYTLLVTEDLSLSALKNNLHNIWIPDIDYIHPLRWRQRVQPDILYREQAHSGFRNKWGFEYPYSDETLRIVKEKYPDTLMWYSSLRNTYDWDYLE